MKNTRIAILGIALLASSGVLCSDAGADDYQYDDGKSNGAHGLTAGGVLVWAQRFAITRGNESIDTIRTVFGTTGVSNKDLLGRPYGAGLWSDPNQDGDPSDGALLGHGNGIVTSQSEDVFVDVSFPPVTIPGGVGTRFFLVVWVEHIPGNFPASRDASVASLGRAWITGEVGGTYDPNGFNPVIGWFELDSIGFPSVYLLRGCAYHEPIPGDLDGDGSVGVSDLLILLASWGPCTDCNDCPTDLDGDCSVGIADLLILLANWG